MKELFIYNSGIHKFCLFVFTIIDTKIFLGNATLLTVPASSAEYFDVSEFSNTRKET